MNLLRSFRTMLASAALVGALLMPAMGAPYQIQGNPQPTYTDTLPHAYNTIVPQPQFTLTNPGITVNPQPLPPSGSSPLLPAVQSQRSFGDGSVVPAVQSQGSLPAVQSQWHPNTSARR